MVTFICIDVTVKLPNFLFQFIFEIICHKNFNLEF